jgi:hypothetical protein
VWDAQSKALLLCDALNNGIFDVEYDKVAKAWIPIWRNLLTLTITLLRSHRNFAQSESIPLRLTMVPFLQSRYQVRLR